MNVRVPSIPTLVRLLVPFAGVITVVEGYTGYNPTTRISDGWATPVIIYGLLLIAWPGRRPRVGLTSGIAAACVAAYAAGAPLAGLSPLVGARIGVANVVATFVLLAGTRRFVRDDDWVLTRPIQGVYWTLLVPVGGWLALMLGGTPAAGFGGTGSPTLDLAWVLRYDGHLIPGGLVLLIITHNRRRSATGVALVRYWPPLLALGVAALLAPYVFTGFPIAWLIFVPALIVGLTLPLRAAAITSVPISLIPALFARTSYSGIGYDGGYGATAPPGTGISSYIPPILALELAVPAASLLAVIVVLIREDAARSRLAAAAQTRRTAAQNEVLTSVVNTMTDAVLLGDLESNIVLANPAARSLLGRLPEGLDGLRTLAERLRSEDGSPLDPQVLHSLSYPSPGQSAQATLRLPRPSGDRFVTVTTRHVMLRSHEHFLAVLTDVTDRQVRRAELESFAGRVAHDLKNPLTGVSLWMDVAEESLVAGDAEAGADAMKRASGASRRMRDLIDDYLAYTVTREGALRRGEVEIADLVAEVFAEYSGPGRTGSFVLDGGATVAADRALVRQLLGTLVAHAVRTARPGAVPEILVTVRAASNGWATIAVADRGLGLTPEGGAALFRPFARSAPDADGGPGLGLAMCHAIVTRHGGSIEATGNIWGGSTIEFTLPMAGVPVG